MSFFLKNQFFISSKTISFFPLNRCLDAKPMDFKVFQSSFGFFMLCLRLILGFKFFVNFFVGMKFRFFKFLEQFFSGMNQLSNFFVESLLSVFLSFDLFG